MNRKNDGHFRGNGVYGAEKLAELFGGIDVRGTMESEDSEAVPTSSILQSEFVADSGLLGDGQKNSVESRS